MAMEEVERVLMLADLSGYTALTEAHGGPQAARIIARYVALAEAALRPGVRIVERAGDALLLVGDAPVPVVQSALELGEAVEREPLFPAVRMGLHAGRVVEQDGRYFGAALNLAARVAAHARAGQILCTAVVAEASAGLPGVEARGLGDVRFKNVPGPVPVFELLGRRAGANGDVPVDPVCHMRVRPESAAGRLVFGDRVYHFCSLDCVRAFASRPEDYVRS
jgi:class 3 adenylate cyclase/YHS domain-containing protein